LVLIKVLYLIHTILEKFGESAATFDASIIEDPTVKTIGALT